MSRLLLYNFLNAAQIGSGLLFQVILARKFGATAPTDGYFLAATVLTAISGIGSLLSEMFLQHYHDLKVGSHDDALRFYAATVSLSVIAGVILSIGGFFLREQIVTLFAFGIDPPVKAAAAQFLAIIIWGLPFTGLSKINSAFLNAELLLGMPYLATNFGNIVSILGILLLGSRIGVMAVAASSLASMIVIAVLQQMYVQLRIGKGVGFQLWHRRIPQLIRSSFTVQIGHQIYMLKDAVVTNALAFLPPGSISLFNYGYRISTLVFSIANSPALLMFASRSARSVAERSFESVTKNIRTFLLQNVKNYFFLCLVVAMALPQLLPHVLGQKFSSADLTRMYFLFLAILPYHVILAFELPFVQTTLAFKSCSTVVRIAVLFLFLYIAFLLALGPHFGIYGVAAALSAAQVFNTGAYIRCVTNQLKQVRL